MAAIDMPTVAPFTDSRPLLDDPAALRERARADGYLFISGLLPAADVLSVRAAMLECAERCGWLHPQAPRMAGRVGQETPRLPFEDGETYAGFYRDFQRQRAFHALAHHPQLTQVIAAVVDGPAFVHPRTIARLVSPGTARWSTPPHQDHFYISGTEDTWTAWVPLGDCPRELGGLAVLPGSQRQGRLPVREAEGAGGHAVDSALDGTWVAGDMACGDVLLFHSLTVHQARDNVTADELRLSADYRFQHADAPIHQLSLEPHGRCLSWEECYAEWPAEDPLRYFWRDQDLDVRDFDGNAID